MALLLTKHGQRAWAEAVSHWRSGGGVAVAEERRGQAGAGDDYGGCYGAKAALLWAKKEAGKTKNGRWALRANVGELKARPGRPGHGG